MSNIQLCVGERLVELTVFSKLASFQYLATIKALDILRVIILRDQSRAFMFAIRIAIHFRKPSILEMHSYS